MAFTRLASQISSFHSILERVRNQAVQFRQAREEDGTDRKIIEGLQWVEGDLDNAVDTLQRLLDQASH